VTIAKGARDKILSCPAAAQLNPASCAIKDFAKKAETMDMIRNETMHSTKIVLRVSFYGKTVGCRLLVD